MKITNLGFPNAYDLKIKKAVEGFWKSGKSLADIELAKKEVADFNAKVQEGLDLRPVFDFDIYDRLLRTALIFGIAPGRFGTAKAILADLGLYLSIPRGTQKCEASSMVKWFNTNYHVVQPEIECEPELIGAKEIPQLKKGKKLALIGPWTLLAYCLNKTNQTTQELFRRLSDLYAALLNLLPEESIVQLEEPAFISHGLPENYHKFLDKIKSKVHLHVYFSNVWDFHEQLFKLPVSGIGLDFVDGAENLDLLDKFPKDKILIAGVINGRNVWPASRRTEKVLDRILSSIDEEKLYISPSCSLIHLPVSAEFEDHHFVFASEKIAELKAIKNETIKYSESKLCECYLTRSREIY